jgi:hypothetical protein
VGGVDAGPRARDAAPRADARRPDAAVPRDAPASRPDAAAALDAAPAPDAAARADGPPRTLPATCEGACAMQSLQVRFGSTTLPIERAVYGLGAGNVLHLEALHGGFAGCPEMSSPTPARTLVLAGLRWPADATPRTAADGLAATLLDYEGTLLPGAPLSRASALTVTPVAASPGAFIALELAATFPEGTVSGHVYAVHCASLD